MNIDFERSKIYEKLSYSPEPAGYQGKLPWIVQQQIAATNGVQYVDRIGKLTDYPSYELPVGRVSNGIMLDIGQGWGRWLVAGSEKGYIPVGVDLRLEFCQVARQTMSARNVNGYTVVADLQNLPFQDQVFDLVWSFSVIQHTHKHRMLACLEHINRILKNTGFAKLEFPNKNGIHNYFGPAKKFASVANDFNSWEVRYYTPGEYMDFFKAIFSEASIDIHSFLGIGVLKEDLKYVSVKNKILCMASLAGTSIAKVIRPLIRVADSLYITAHPAHKSIKQTSHVQDFLHAHQLNPKANLNVVHLLKCLVTGDKLVFDANRNLLINESKTIGYPVIDHVPIMIESEIVRLS